MTTRTLNAHNVGRATHPGRVYVGRPSKWGNPFVIGRDGDRDAVIGKFREWIKGQPQLLSVLGELAGKDLVCWCAPCACHADVLREMATKFLADEPARIPIEFRTLPPQTVG